MATPTWTSTPAPALTPTPASEQGPRRQGPGLYGPSQVRRPPPRHPFRPRMTTVPMPLAPQNQDRDRDRAQGTTAFMMDMNMNMNNVPPHPHSYPHANANTSAGVGASLNAPSGDPGPSASASATQQQVPPPPAILLTTDSRGNSPIVLQSEGLKGSENRNGNGAQAQPPPQPQILPQPKKRDKHDEEKEREKERRDRARLLAGLAPSPRREAPRFSGITSPTSVSISRSSIPPALMPGGGIEVPTGVHITSKADTGRFKPTKSDIALGEPDLNLHVEKGLKNIVGKVVKGIRGLKALGAFAGGDGGNRETLGWKADREQVSSRRPGGFFGEDSALNASPDGYEGGYYSSHRDGNPPEGTPGAGPSTTPMHTSRGLSTSPPPPPPQQQQQQQRPQFRTRAHTPAPSEAPTFMTSATGVTGTVRGHSPPSREDFMLQDFMRKKRIMRDKAFKAGRGFWNGVPSESE